MNQFHLFRAPGDPGYIAGASTYAGHIDGSETGDCDLDKIVDAAVSDAIAAMGMTWLGNGDLIGPCGLLLDEDYMEQLEDVSAQAFAAACN
jgi:hypothetical protein